MILKKIYWKMGFKRERFFFFLAGFFFALAGIAIGRLIFSQNIGLVAVFLTSLAAISIVDKQISLSEILLGKIKRLPNRIIFIDEILTVEHRVTLKSVYEDHKYLFSTYFFLFLGIMACYSAVTIALPVEQSSKLFGEQFEIISGQGLGPIDTFIGLITNNFFVLLTGFFLALLFESGTTFIIVWNASVWGTAFALVTKNPWITLTSDPFINFVFLLLLSFPHLVLEIVSYFASTIAGGLLNKAIIAENFMSIRFKIIAAHSTVLFLFGLLTLLIGAAVETLVIMWLA